MTTTTELAIVIVSFNTRANLERCLASLVAHTPAVPCAIIVVDNGSRDGSPDAVRRHGPSIRLIETGGNLGFARANNLGIRNSQSELVLLLNGDTVVPDGAIDGLVETLRARPDVAIVGPRLAGEDGTVELSFGSMMSPLQEARQKLLGRGHARRWPLLHSYVERLLRREQYTDWVSGACLLVRRADAMAAGLLDERFFLYGEDVDFCAAVRRLRRKVLFTPAVEVIHLRGRSRLAAPAASEAAYRRSQLAFYAKHHPGWLPILRGYLRIRGKLPREVRDLVIW